MLDDFDNTLKHLLETRLPEGLRKQVTITFAAPDKDFPPPSVFQPAVDLFLCDIRENRNLSSSEPVAERKNGLVLPEPSPFGTTKFRELRFERKIPWWPNLPFRFPRVRNSPENFSRCCSRSMPSVWACPPVLLPSSPAPRWINSVRRACEKSEARAPLGLKYTVQNQKKVIVRGEHDLRPARPTAHPRGRHPPLIIQLRVIELQKGGSQWTPALASQCAIRNGEGL